jgi:hypothetical protein
LNAPFDLHCPSLEQSEIIKRTCPVCGVYHSSQASVKRHQRIHTTESADNQMLDDDVSNAVDIETATQQTDDIPVIRNLFDWVQSAFESCGR